MEVYSTYHNQPTGPHQWRRLENNDHACITHLSFLPSVSFDPSVCMSVYLFFCVCLCLNLSVYYLVDVFCCLQIVLLSLLCVLYISCMFTVFNACISLVISVTLCSNTHEHKYIINLSAGTCLCTNWYIAKGF